MTLEDLNKIGVYPILLNGRLSYYQKGNHFGQANGVGQIMDPASFYSTYGIQPSQIPAVSGNQDQLAAQGYNVGTSLANTSTANFQSSIVPGAQSAYTSMNQANAEVPTNTPQTPNTVGKTSADLVSSNQGNSTSGYYKVAVPKTIANPGGFNVYDANNNLVSYASLPKGPTGNPLLNIDSLPVKSSPSSSQGTGGMGGGSGPADPSGPTTYYKVPVPVSATNPGGYDVYDSNGTHILDASKLGPNGTPLNIDNLPIHQSPGGTGVAYDPSWSTYGVTQDVWNSMNATQQGVISVSLNSAKSLYSANASDVTLQTALAAAAKDPTLIAKYADAAGVDLTAFNQSLAQIQTATSTDSQNKQMQFENERKALAEQFASAGAAYSGFRGNAQAQLATTESGIVTSSRAQIQQQLDQQRAAFEAKYGTASTPAANINFNDPYASSNFSIAGLYTPNGNINYTLNGNVTGGITGSEVTGKQQDINTLASNYVTLGQTPAITPAA